MYVPNKTRKAMTDALNGDADKVDAAVRRALFAITTELDEHAAESAASHARIVANMDAHVAKMDKSVAQLRNLLVSTTITFIIALATATLNLILN
jgi:hypothetical protein